MKKLYIIRHAESDLNFGSDKDFERVLNEKGRTDTSSMLTRLNSLKFDPSLVFCSPAKRTKETAQLICPDRNIILDDTIYEASLDCLTQLINSFPDSHQEIALIGHNPSITSCANYLTDKFINNLPTCSVVKLDLEINSWTEITRGIGVEKFIITPR